MPAPRNWLSTLACIVCLGTLPLVAQAQPPSPAAAASPAPAEAPKFENDVCLGCHGNAGFAAPGADGKARSLHVVGDKFGKSVHGKRLCVECHKDITAIPHPPGVQHKVSCVQCHEALWEVARKDGKTAENARLGDKDAENIAAFYAVQKPQAADKVPSSTQELAQQCNRCHDAENAAVVAPILKGQDKDYLAMSLRSYRDGKRESSTMHNMSTVYSNAIIQSLSAWYASQPAK